MNVVFEKTGIHYRQEGEYALPNLEVPESPKVGAWGEHRRKHLRNHQKALYTAMLLGDTLNAHLEEIDRSATKMFDRLIEQMKGRDGITEDMKAAKKLERVQRMKVNWQEEAEIVIRELICV